MASEETRKQVRRRSQGRRASSPTAELRDGILKAAAELLAERRFSDLTVADILQAAQVSRGSFYFYFSSKQEVLAELVRAAVGEGMDAAEAWLERPADPKEALRSGITAGARLWRTNAPVLRAIVEHWQDDPQLRELWLQQMQSYADATVAQITGDPEVMAHLAGQDPVAVATALTWLGERMYYLAACELPPFDREDRLVETLLHIWMATLYGAEAPPP